MKTFTELMATTPPRLEVHFRRGEDGGENFQWGIAGNGVPVMTMIGAIVRAQAELPLIEPGDSRHACDVSALILIWDTTSKSVHWFVGPDIPVDPLIGMMETIKDLLVSSQLAKRVVAQQSRILGPGGAPMR